MWKFSNWRQTYNIIITATLPKWHNFGKCVTLIFFNQCIQSITIWCIPVYGMMLGWLWHIIVNDILDLFYMKYSDNWFSEYLNKDQCLHHNAWSAGILWFMISATVSIWNILINDFLSSWIKTNICITMLEYLVCTSINIEIHVSLLNICNINTL